MFLFFLWVPGYVLPDVPMNTWQKGGAHLVDVPVMIGKSVQRKRREISTQADW